MYPAPTSQSSPIRDLILKDFKPDPSNLDNWKTLALTPATLAIFLETVLSRARRERLPQYEVFKIFPRSCPIISFNWDGLAVERCPQEKIIHVHGKRTGPPIPLPILEELVDLGQMDDESSGEWALSGRLVFPGQEHAIVHGPLGQQIHREWRLSSAVVMIGFSLGLGRHDREWLDLFVDAMSDNHTAIHVVAPDSREIVGHLQDRLQRVLNIFAWPLKWRPLAIALIRERRRQHLHWQYWNFVRLAYEYRRLAEIH
jgi:hypothetical protein